MWIVAKVNYKQLSVFKSELNLKFENKVKYYFPKVFIKNKKTNITKNILGNYIFCFHEKFEDLKNILVLKYIKGLDYFLTNSKNSQIEILDFINLCKINENSTGHLKQDFFKNLICKNGKFINSPLASLVFEIIKSNKNNLEILLGNKQIKISKKSDILYLPA